ncbi:hypothetical protein BH09MYX1_BH09MYX1_63800 [soil metagenome]
MRARALLVPFAAAFVCLTLTARADAPAGQYDSFSKASPAIRDKNTLLIWQRYGVVASNGTLADAVIECGKAQSLGGSGRLPTVKELLTLVDEDPHGEASSNGTVDPRAIDRNAFPATPVDARYLATEAGGGVWLVSFTDGSVQWQSSLTPPRHYVRCVRAE